VDTIQRLFVIFGNPDGESALIGALLRCLNTEA
jgi:hypothetical protein